MVKIALCEGQSGTKAKNMDDWNFSWKLVHQASEVSREACQSLRLMHHIVMSISAIILQKVIYCSNYFCHSYSYYNPMRLNPTHIIYPLPLFFITTLIWRHSQYCIIRLTVCSPISSHFRWTLSPVIWWPVTEGTEGTSPLGQPQRYSPLERAPFCPPCPLPNPI